jgi:hypothetical protein
MLLPLAGAAAIVAAVSLIPRWLRRRSGR